MEANLMRLRTETCVDNKGIQNGKHYNSHSGFGISVEEQPAPWPFRIEAGRKKEEEEESAPGRFSRRWMDKGYKEDGNGMR